MQSAYYCRNKDFLKMESLFLFWGKGAFCIVAKVMQNVLFRSLTMALQEKE
jgi:hypothetical protein